MGHFCCPLLLGFGLLSNFGRYSVEYWLMTWSSGCVDFFQAVMDGVNRHKLTPRLSVLEWRDVSRLLWTKLSLGAQIISRVWVNWTQPIHQKDPRRLKVSTVVLGSLRPSKAFLLAIGKAKRTSPARVTSQDKATALVLPLEVNLALLCRAFPTSEVRRALLLALSSALRLASRHSLLTLGAENDARSAMLLACAGVLVLASCVTGLTLTTSVIEASGATVASL